MWQPVKTASNADLVDANGNKAPSSLAVGTRYTVTAGARKSDRSWTLHLVTHDFYQAGKTHHGGLLLSAPATFADGKVSASFTPAADWKGQKARVVLVGAREREGRAASSLKTIGLPGTYTIG